MPIYTKNGSDVTALTTRQFTLGSLVRDLVKAGIIDAKDASRAGGGSSNLHPPIIAVARMDLNDQRAPGRKLTTALLSHWVALKGVLVQRLVRRLCTDCREEVSIELRAWRSLAGSEEKPPDTAYAARGCLECRKTGYRGKVGIYELLVPAAALRAQITENADMKRLRDASNTASWIRLRQSGARKVALGETTLGNLPCNARKRRYVEAIG